MFAQLGAYIFENIKSFKDFSKRDQAVYAEHSLIDGKPKLQRTGSALSEINISITFHVSFCNPKEEVLKLSNSRNAGEILPLLWGNGDLEGDFIISEMEETREDADAQGNIFSCNVDLVLKEYAGKTKIQQERATNIKNAKAVGEKKPTAKQKKNPATCPQLISSLISKIESHGAAVNTIMLQGGGATGVPNKSKLKSNLTAISKYAFDIKNRCDQPGSCIYQNDLIRIRATEVYSTADIMKLGVETDSPDVTTDNTNLQARIRNLRAAARSLTTQVITRN